MVHFLLGTLLGTLLGNPLPRKLPEEITVHSRADLFRGIGERLRVGIGRSGKQEGTPLEAIIYFVRETSEDTQAA